MADTSQLQANIQTQQRAAQESRNRASQFQGQIDGIQREIARLESELRDVKAFSSKAQADGDTVRGQLRDRERIVDQIGSLENSSLARQLAEQLMRIQLPQARDLLTRGMTDATAEVDRAARKIQKRIDELVQQLNSLRLRMNQELEHAHACDRAESDLAQQLQATQNSNT